LPGVAVTHDAAVEVAVLMEEVVEDMLKMERWNEEVKLLMK